jgi:uncharacterized protein involved in copper resistance
MTLRIGRNIIAILISLSVATLPAAAGFAAVSAAADMSMSSAMPDCDHHNHATPANKPQKTADDCMAACALHCFNFTTTGFSDVAFLLPASATLRPARVDGAVSSLIGNPPFRPPRI